jgi:hypothetical protein
LRSIGSMSLFTYDLKVYEQNLRYCKNQQTGKGIGS